MIFIQGHTIAEEILGCPITGDQFVVTARCYGITFTLALTFTRGQMWNLTPTLPFIWNRCVLLNPYGTRALEQIDRTGISGTFLLFPLCIKQLDCIHIHVKIVIVHCLKNGRLH